MIREIITFNQNQIEDKAEEFFLSMLGKPSLENCEILNNQRKEALQIRENVRYELLPKAICKLYDQNDIDTQTLHLQGDKLKLEHSFISCDGFNKISPSNILSATLFIITCETILPQGNALDDLYVDMWQTAYLDAARSIIRQKRKDKLIMSDQDSFYISPSFGPGYYGMQLSELDKFYELLKGEDIGISIQRGLLHPLKTCTGIFIDLNEAEKDFNACMYCVGNHSQCEFCNEDGKIQRKKGKGI